MCKMEARSSRCGLLIQQHLIQQHVGPSLLIPLPLALEHPVSCYGSSAAFWVRFPTGSHPALCPPAPSHLMLSIALALRPPPAPAFMLPTLRSEAVGVLRRCGRHCAGVGYTPLGGGAGPACEGALARLGEQHRAGEGAKVEGIWGGGRCNGKGRCDVCVGCFQARKGRGVPRGTCCTNCRWQAHPDLGLPF
jgi:hypothetical protein